MTDDSIQATLIPIWEQHRNRILGYGHALYGLLPDGDPPVSLHGRDLRTHDEGVGFHVQYTLIDDVYNGAVVSACFAVQIELVATSITSVKVDAVPLLEYRDGHYQDHRPAWHERSFGRHAQAVAALRLFVEGFCHRLLRPGPFRRTDRRQDRRIRRACPTP